MSNEKWASELETGIYELDRDSRTLMGLMDGVIAASQTSDLPSLRGALIKLQDQSKIDFDREDGLMNALRYQGAPQHQTEHRQLLAEIQHQIDDLDAEQVHMPSLLRFQKNWLTQHISSQDILLGQAVLTQKGIHDRRHKQPQRMTEDELDAFEDRRQGLLEQIVWTHKLDVGIASIDADHRAMVELYNAIVDASQSHDHERISTLLEQLGNLTAADFEAEDKLMSQVGYAHAHEHREEHQELLREYGHQVDDWRANQISADFLCRFMYRWLRRHILVADRPLGKAIQRHGGQQHSG